MRQFSQLLSKIAVVVLGAALILALVFLNREPADTGSNIQIPTTTEPPLPDVIFYLPETIYCVVGVDYEIYNHQVYLDAYDYEIEWSGTTHFTNNGEYITLCCPAAGTTTLSVSVSIDGQVIRSDSVTVCGIEQATQDIYLLSFGDSLTNHCKWQAELLRTADNLHCVGSRGRTPKGTDGVYRQVYDEGRSGFTSFDYTTGASYLNGTDLGGAEEQNKWFDGITFSMSYFMNNHFPADQQNPNVMTFWLGMNDLIDDELAIEAIIANMKTMLDSIRSYDATLPIVMVAPQIRYDASDIEKERFMEFSRALEDLSKAYSSVVFVPTTIGMDSVNGYDPSDITHPNVDGYVQISKWIMAAISQVMQEANG